MSRGEPKPPMLAREAEEPQRVKDGRARAAWFAKATQRKGMPMVYGHGNRNKK